MSELLGHRWYLLAARGAAAVVFGVIALLWPGLTVGVLATLFGVYVLADGVLALALALGGHGRDDRKVVGVEGLFDIVAGGVVLAWPDVTPRALLLIIAGWAIATGVAELTGAVRLRRDVEHEWLLAAAGATSVLVGVVLGLSPDAGLVAVAWLIGAYGVAFGAMTLGLASKLHSAGEGGPPASAGGGGEHDGGRRRGRLRALLGER